MILFLLLTTFVHAQTLEKDAGPLIEELKKNMMSNLQRELAKGSGEALDFCQVHAAEITSESLKSKASKYEIGRTSHKLRNPSNTSFPWMKEYFDKFQGTQKGALPMSIPIIHKEKNGKRVWFNPIYTEALCLQCHGDKVSPTVEAALKKNYPSDKARGFQLGEFRGFFWVKEK